MANSPFDEEDEELIPGSTPEDYAPETEETSAAVMAPTSEVDDFAMMPEPSAPPAFEVEPKPPKAPRLSPDPRNFEENLARLDDHVERTFEWEAEQKAKQERKAFMESRRAHNAEARKVSAATGAQFNYDETGVAQPRLDPLTGEQKFTKRVSPVRWDEQGRPFQVVQNEGGTRSERISDPDANAKLGPNPNNPEDRFIYRQTKFQPWEAIDPEEGINSKDGRVVKASAEALKAREMSGVRNELDQTRLALRDPNRANRLTPEARAKMESDLQAFSAEEPPPAEVKGMFGGVNVEATERAKSDWKIREQDRQARLGEIQTRLQADDERAGLEQKAFDLDSRRVALEQTPLSGYLQERRKKKAESLADLDPETARAEIETRSAAIAEEDAAAETAMFDLQKRSDALNERTRRGLTIQEMESVAAERAAIEADAQALDERIARRNAGAQELVSGVEAIKAKQDQEREASYSELDRQATKYPELAEDAKSIRAVDDDFRARAEAIQSQPEGPGRQAALDTLNQEYQTKRQQAGSAYVAKLEQRVSGDVGAAIEKIAGPGGAIGFKSQIAALEADPEIDPEIKKIASDVIREQAVDALIRSVNMQAVGPAVKSDKPFSEAVREAGWMDAKNPEDRAKAAQMLEQDPGLGAKLLDGFDRVMTTFGARVFGAVSAVGKAASYRLGLDPDNMISQAAEGGFNYKVSSEAFREKYRDPRLDTDEAMNRWIMPAVSEALPNLAGMALTAIPVVGPGLAVTYSVGQLYDEAYSQAMQDESLSEADRHNAATIYSALALPAELLGDVVTGGVFTARMIPKAAKQQSAEAAAKFWSKFSNVGEVWDKLPPVLKRGVAIVTAGGTEGLTETVQDKILNATIETIKTGDIGASVQKAMEDNRGALDTFIIASISGGGIKTLETATRTLIERGQDPETMARRYTGVANSFRPENVAAYAQETGVTFNPEEYQDLTRRSEGLTMRLDRINPKDKVARNDVARELAQIEARRLTIISEILGKQTVDEAFQQAAGGQSPTAPTGTPPPPILPENIAAMQAEIGTAPAERQAPLSTAIKILTGAPMDSLTKAEQDAIKPHVAKVGGQTVLTDDILGELSQVSPQAASLMDQGSIRDEAARRLEILETEQEGGDTTNENESQQKGTQDAGQGLQTNAQGNENAQGGGTQTLTPGGAAEIPSLPPLPVGRAGELTSNKERKVALTLAARLVQGGADRQAAEKFSQYFVNRETLRGWGSEKLNAAIEEFNKAGGMQNPQAIIASVDASSATQRTEIENFTSEVLKQLDADPNAASMTAKDRSKVEDLMRNRIVPSLLRFRPIIRGIVASFDKAGDSDVQVNRSEQLLVNAAYMLSRRGADFWASSENTDLLIDEEIGHISQIKVMAEIRRERTGEVGAEDMDLAMREAEEVFLQLPEPLQQASRRIYGVESSTPGQSGMEFFRQMLQGDIAISEGRILDKDGKVISELAINDRPWIEKMKSMFERLFKVFTDLRGNLGTMLRDEGRSDAEIEELTSRVERIRKESFKFFQNLKKEGDRIRTGAYGQEYAKITQSAGGQPGGGRGTDQLYPGAQDSAATGNRQMATAGGTAGQLAPAGNALGQDQATRLAELESRESERAAREERAKERRAEYVATRAGDLKDYEKVVASTPEDAREPVSQLLGQAPSGKAGYVLAVNQRRLPSTWVALPPGVVQTSHIGPDFQKNPEYAGQNTRAYDRDPAEQNKVRAGALPGALNEDILTSTDPSSANSAPQVAIVIDQGPDGQPRARWQAAGGNAREMMSNLAPQEDQERLSQTWRDKGEQFGFGEVPEGFRGYRFLGVFDIRTEAGARDYQKLVDDLNPSTGVVQDIADRADLDAKNIPLDLIADLPVTMSGKQAVDALSRLLTAPGNIVERNRIEPMAKNPAQAQAFMQRVMFTSGLGQPTLSTKIADYQLQNKNAAFVELAADAAKAGIALRQTGNPGIADSLGQLLSNVSDYLDQGRTLKTSLELAASQIEMDALVGDTAVAALVTQRLSELVVFDKRGRLNSEATGDAMKDYMTVLANGIARASEEATMGDFFGSGPATMADRIAAINEAHRRKTQLGSETTLSAPQSNSARRIRELELKRRQEGLTMREAKELTDLEAAAGQQFMDFFQTSQSMKFELEQEVDRRGIPRAPVEQMEMVLSAPPSQARTEAAAAFKPNFRSFAPSTFLGAEQQQIEKDFYDQLISEPQAAEAAYAELEGTEGGRVLDMDEARELSGVYSQSKMARTLHAGSVQQGVRAFIVDYMLEKKFSAPAPAESYIGLTAGGPGSGKSRIKRLSPEEWDGAEFVYDGTLQNFEAAQVIIEKAKQTNRNVKIWYVHVPVEQAVKQAVERTARAGRALGLQILTSAHYNAQQTAIKLLNQYAGDPDVSISVIDNTEGRGIIVEDPLTFLTSESIQYREPNETQTRAKKELGRHLRQIVPAARRVWLAQRPKASDSGGIESGLAPVWRRRGPLPASTDRDQRLSAPRRQAADPNQLGFDFSAPEVQTYKNTLEAEGITAPQAQAAAAMQDLGIPAGPALDLFTAPSAAPAIEPAATPETTQEPTAEPAQIPSNPLTEPDLARRDTIDGIPGAIPLDAEGGLAEPGDGPAAQPAPDTAPTGADVSDPARLRMPAEEAFAEVDYAPAREWGLQVLAERFLVLRETTKRPLSPPIYRQDYERRKAAFDLAAEIADRVYRDTLQKVDAAYADNPGRANRLLPRLPEVRELFTDANGEVQLIGSRPVEIEEGEVLSAPRRQTYDPNQLELDFEAAPRDPQAAQADADKSAAARFQSALPAALQMAGTYSNIPGVDMDEVRQTARIALANASRSFDPARGVPFEPFASIVVRNRLNQLYRRESLRREREPQSLDEPMPGDFTETRQDYTPDTTTPDAATTATRNEARGLIAELIGSLPERMRAAVDGYLRQRQQEEIGEEFGISKQAVSRLQQEGFKRLRQKLNERGISSVGELLSAPQKNTPTGSERAPFYLKSAEVLDQKVQGKTATLDQIKALLSPQNGIKAEEVKWTGVLQEAERLAKENNGKVPKDALMEFLANDGTVRLEEVNLGAQDSKELEELYFERGILRSTGKKSDELDAKIARLEAAEKNTKYEQYQLPGGENYREVVLAMPIDPDLVNAEADRTEGGTYRSALARLAYTSSHFPEVPNYVAHMRLNEREDGDGNPGLFIEELQSDRHQAGRDKGYREDAAITEEQIAAEGLNLEWENAGQRYVVRDEFGNAFGEGATRMAALNDLAKTRASNRVPDAPFRTTWPVQLFKRALRDAVASGKEWIGWTTGETQAERYDLSKQAQGVIVDRQSNGKFSIQVKPIGQKDYEVVQRGVTADKVEEYIGKELAAKLEDKDRNQFEGIDLKLGGDGMKGFYDQILPKEIAKYVKQWGGKVEKSEIVIAPAYAGDPEGFPDKKSPIWRVGITSQMRESVQKTGQALFAPPGTPQGDGDFIDPDADFSRDLDELLKNLQGVPADIDSAVPLQERAALEEGGGQTYQVGRADLAFGAKNPDVRGLDQFYTDRFLPETEAQWSNAATDMLQKDFEGTRRQIEQAGLNGQTISPELTKAADQIESTLRQRMLQTGKDEDRRAYNVFWYAYRSTGTEAGRALAARRDPFKTPAMRHREFLLDVMLTPGKKDKAEIEAEKDPAKKAAIIDRVTAALLKKLKDAGITPEDILGNRVVVGLNTAEIQRQFRAGLTPKQGEIFDLLLRKKFTPAEIASRTGAKPDAVESVFTAFKNRMRQQHFAKFQAGIHKQSEAGILSAPATQTPQPAGLFGGKVSDSEAEAAFDQWFGGMMGVSDAKKIGRPRFRIDDPAHVMRLARAIQSARGEAGLSEMAYEWWIMNILSGPQTQVVNIAGNSGFLALDTTLQRGMEALVNVFIRDKNSAQLGEFRPLLKGILPGITKGFAMGAKAWSAEHDFFEHTVLGTPLELGQWDKLGNTRAAIPGQAGKVIRIPGRALLFADSFFKQLSGQMNVAAFAYRIAKAEGLTGQALTDRVALLSKTRNEIVSENMPSVAPSQEMVEYFARQIARRDQSLDVAALVANRSSEAWELAREQAAYDAAKAAGWTEDAWIRAVDKSKEMTFQQDLQRRADGANLFEDAAAKLQDSRFNNQLIGFFFPFVKTPYNIFRTGIRKSPLGAANFAFQAGKGFLSMKDGKPFLEGDPTLVRDLSEQLIAWSAMALIFGAVQGDEDDDEKMLLITGSQPNSVSSAGLRDLNNRATGGEYVIRIGGRNGITIPYGRLDPIATVLGTTVDTIRAIKRNGTTAENIGSLWNFMVAQTNSKTFLQGLANIATIMEGKADPVGATQRTILQALVPNIIRQPLRNLDDYLRDTKTAPATYTLFPSGNLAEPKIDIYGNEIRKGSTPVMRLFLNSALATEPTLQATDRLLLNWNTRNPSMAYAPEQAKAIYKGRDGKEKEMTAEEARRYRLAAGRLAAARLRTVATPARIANPTEQDIKDIKDVFSNARREVRERMFAER